MSVEDKIKELLEQSMAEATAPGKGGGKADAMQKVDGDKEDLGPAVVEPEAKSGPDGSKKVKKASAPGGDKPAEPMAKVKEEAEEDEDLDEVSEGELPPALAKAIAKKKAEKGEDEGEEEEGDEEEKSESKKSVKEAKVTKEEDDEEESDDDDDEDDMEEMKHGKKMVKASYKSEDIDLGDDVAALAEAVALDEETQAKAKTIFEAAVLSKVNEHVAEINEAFEQAIEEETAKLAEDLTDKVDTYLSYVVEQWTADNELAIERGLKSEITEDFIVSLKKVFEEHYIDVPEDKYDVMAEQQDKIAELEQKLNEQIEKTAETAKIVNEAKKAIKIEESAKDLTDTQKEKFMSLVEGVEFADEDSFAKELETLKESYFPKVAKPIEEDEVAVEEVTEAVNLTGEMKDYVSAISRTLGK
jgi:hypothetical protein